MNTVKDQLNYYIFQVRELLDEEEGSGPILDRSQVRRYVYLVNQLEMIAALISQDHEAKQFESLSSLLNYMSRSIAYSPLVSNQVVCAWHWITSYCLDLESKGNG